LTWCIFVNIDLISILQTLLRSPYIIKECLITLLSNFSKFRVWELSLSCWELRCSKWCSQLLIWCIVVNFDPISLLQTYSKSPDMGQVNVLLLLSKLWKFRVGEFENYFYTNWKFRRKTFVQKKIKTFFSKTLMWCIVINIDLISICKIFK